MGGHGLLCGGRALLKHCSQCCMLHAKKDAGYLLGTAEKRHKNNLRSRVHNL